MGFDNVCNTGLMLGLGFSSTVESTNPVKKVAIMSFEPSLKLALSGDTTYDDDHDQAHVHHNKVDSIKASDGSGGNNLHRQDSGAAASSFSNISVKREREPAASEEVETTTTKATREVVNFRSSSSRVISDEDDDGVNGRKKLRLTKAQSALLEESFKSHSTLNPKQKLELARDLKLRPRQVEVWFQNRRARTKLKQTEVDCEYLKKCCETLTDENRRLQKELQELKALKLAQPFYMQLPAATLTMCPSCERVVGDSTATTKSPFNAMAPKSHLFNPFTNPSAAC